MYIYIYICIYIYIYIHTCIQRELPAAFSTYVVVLPDSATSWQVEVLGSLAIAGGVYMVYEGANDNYHTIN